MQKVEVTKVFRAPGQQVWDRYTDHCAWTEWAGLGRVSLDREGDPAPNGVGCVRVFSNAGFRVYEEVLSFDPPVRMTYRLVKGAVPLRDHLGEVTFEAQGDDTLVTWRCQFNSGIPGCGGLLRRMITRMFASVLDRLDAQLAR
jgi:uncharacterized protein YndB with AHSA1/START domain